MDALQRLLIVEACRDLVLRAAAQADAGDATALAALFTERAVLARPNAEPLQGRAAIRASYAQRPAERITRHLVTNTVVVVESPGTSRALSSVLLWAGSSADADGPRGRPAQGGQLVGEFDDRLTLTAEGWRIERREARFVMHSA